MTINKFQGKTQEEAVEKAKKEMGESVVIMNVKEIKPKGLFSALKSTTFEVTAALEEKEQQVNLFSALNTQRKTHETINYAADEKIEIPRETVSSYHKAEGEENNGLEEKIESLQNLLEKNLSGEEKAVDKLIRSGVKENGAQS